jgi:CheY-like chemotaxis protein
MAERILIVDDDPVQRRLLENMATRAGYEALVAEGGDAAVALLTGAEGTRIDAVVLDLVMPDLDGLGVLGKMRAAGLAIPVIVQTAHGGIDNVVNAMRAGAADFVVKPVGAERLHLGESKRRRGAISKFTVHDEDFRLGVIEHEGDGWGIETRVERIEHTTRHRHTVMDLQHGGRVGEQYRHRVAAFDAFARQRRGKPARARVEFRVVAFQLAVNDGGARGMHRGGSLTRFWDEGDTAAQIAQPKRAKFL